MDNLAWCALPRLLASTKSTHNNCLSDTFAARRNIKHSTSVLQNILGSIAIWKLILNQSLLVESSMEWKSWRHISVCTLRWSSSYRFSQRAYAIILSNVASFQISSKTVKRCSKNDSSREVCIHPRLPEKF